MAKKPQNTSNLTPPSDPLQALSDELDGLLIESVKTYRSGLNARSLTPGDIKAPLLAQVRNRIKDLWAMNKAATGDEAEDLLERANQIANSMANDDKSEGLE